MKSHPIDVETPPSPRSRRPLFVRGRFLIAGLVLAGALGYLIYVGVQGASMYYLSVSELATRGEAAYENDVRLGGKVMEDSLRQDSSTMTAQFMVTDGQRSVPVTYTGVLPDAFKPGADVVVEGRLGASGVFEASTLLAKCPSKYEPAADRAG
jgi:cytochrome c-type biogenesis protein CcmE